MDIRRMTARLSLALLPAILIAAQLASAEEGRIKHVLLISVDGMHALDFSNCSHGISGVNGGAPYCPTLAALAHTGVNYLAASTSKPSDSFPGLTALVTGGTPRSTGAFYDVSYDRSLSPPAATTPYGIVGGKDLCPGVVGTQIGFDEEIDRDLTRLDAGGGINPDFLPRDPQRGCAPVYPHSFIRVNTIFEVVRAHGGYTAWSDKHQSYELTKGKSGMGVDDFFSPEINSIPVALPQVAGCNPLPDQGTATASNAWTDSFQNIRCYDSIKVQAILNEIDGRTHDGTKPAAVPNLFGMNFQAVSVGEKLVEKSLSMTGGYLDAAGTPSAALLSEIQFVDDSIGKFVNELKNRGLYESTLIVVSAKHGQSPIDPKRVQRITHDLPNDLAPSDALGGIGGPMVAQADEDDISLIWLNDQNQTASAASQLETQESTIGGGEIFFGKSLNLLFNNPERDPRTPDIIVTPDVGVIYTGGGKKIAEHGGFAHDDTNVIMLLSNPRFRARTFVDTVETRQVAPTILQVLGLDPDELDAVRKEGTTVLPLFSPFER